MVWVLVLSAGPLSVRNVEYPVLTLVEEGRGDCDGMHASSSSSFPPSSSSSSSSSPYPSLCFFFLFLFHITLMCSLTECSGFLSLSFFPSPSLSSSLIIFHFHSSNYHQSLTDPPPPPPPPPLCHYIFFPSQSLSFSLHLSTKATCRSYCPYSL